MNQLDAQRLKHAINALEETHRDEACTVTELYKAISEALRYLRIMKAEHNKEMR